MKKLSLFLLSLITVFGAMARNLSGTVVSASDGEPVIGASVLVKGTSVGVATDIDGNFTIDVPDNGTLEVRSLGYKTQTIKLTPALNNLKVELVDDTQMLDEVVAIGYGTQKKSVVTAAIAKVTGDDLIKNAPVRMDNALKGLAAGVEVTSASGQPGDGARVRIRGIGTINDSNPLYVVDGMVLEGGLDFVNPNDIESIEVLKDAASAAIYGSRAANGVILVTTKKGKVGKVNINYNFSYGWQNAAKKRKVTGATDYAILQNERALNNGTNPIFEDPYNIIDINGNKIVGFGTDWQEAVFYDNAPIMNNDFSISGANERVNYYLSLGYFSQDGIVGGNYGQSNYDRLSLRSNTRYNIFDETASRNYLNKVDLDVNLAYSRIHSTGISTNSEFGSVLGSALYLAPTLPITITNPDVARDMMNFYSYEDIKGEKHNYEYYKDENGDPYTVAGYGGSYQEMNNPLAMLHMNPTKNWANHFMGNFAAELTIWDTVKYRFSYGADMSFWGNESATLETYYLSGNNQASHTSVGMYKANNIRWQIENTLSWNKTFGKHTVGLVLGQSAMKYKGNDLSGSRWNLMNPAKPYLNYTDGVNVATATDADGNITKYQVQMGVGGGIWAEHRMSSLFARATYDYDNKYMLSATIRRDGSSRFGSNNKYGTFPSVSAGWNITNEQFMENTRDWLNNLKFRVSWGKNGNDRIGDFAYTSLTAMGNNVLFGKTATKWSGSKATQIANPDLKWEESEQTDLGLDFGFFNNALTFTVDYFIKKTNGMIITMPIPSYVGESKPLGNVGDMKNSGVEFELGYRFNVADAQFSIKGNATYLKNTLTNLGNSEGFLNLDNIQGYQGNVTRAENGMPFPFFYGYKTDGVFQNQAEIDAYRNADGGLIQPKATPGDVRFVDINGDGLIDDNDRTDIGNGTPDWSFGLTVNAFWKGFDLNIFFQGVTGADVFDGTFRNDVFSGNYPAWMLARWTGEGSSNKYPKIGGPNSDANWKVSDLYVCDGSYFRLKNLTIGYTLPENLTRKVSIQRLRFYVQADNLVTCTKYWGFDPEIASGGTSLGIDRGVYPQARTWTVGLNVSF